MPSLVGGIGRLCHGLTQVCVQFQPPCKDLESESCAAFKASLLDPHYNLEWAARSLSQTKRFCRRKTGRPATMEGILFQFQGFAGGNKWCAMQKKKGRWRPMKLPKLTRKVLRYRAQLRREFR